MPNDTAVDELFTPVLTEAWALPVQFVQPIGGSVAVAKAVLDSLVGEEVVVTYRPWRPGEAREVRDTYHCTPIRPLSGDRYEVMEGRLPSVLFLGEIVSIELVAPE